jgi:hypothetical protein
MWERHGDEVAFLVVYLREAHALDSPVPLGGEDEMPIVEDPIDLAERRAMAEVCMTRLALEPIPAVVDEIDDRVGQAWDAHPDRLYLVGRDGRIAYRGARGPFGFLPDELEEAIRAELHRAR